MKLIGESASNTGKLKNKDEKPMFSYNEEIQKEAEEAEAKA